MPLSPYAQSVSGLKRECNMRLIVFVLLCICLNLYSQNTTSRYITLSWGKNANELRSIKDDFVYGPEHFQVLENGLCFIMDIYPGSLKAFDDNGKLVRHYKDSEGRGYINFFVLKDGRILIKNDKSTIFMDESGASLKRFSNFKYPGISIGKVSESDDHLFLISSLGYVYVFRKDMEAPVQEFSTSFLSKKFGLVNIFRDQIFCLQINKQNKKDVKIRSITYQPDVALNKLLSKASIRKINVESILLRLIGMDKYGNVYMTGEAYSPYNRIIYKLDSELKLIGQKKILNSLHHYMDNSIVVSQSGDIYIANSDKNEFWIDKISGRVFD